jgi:hypothetical protein
VIPTNIKNDSLSQPSQAGPVTPIAPVPAISDRAQSTPNFTQGNIYQGLVKDRLHNGNARVLIAGQLLQMQLPENIQSGNKIELVFIAREPQLKFMLLPLGTENNPPNISSAGRLLAFLAQDALQSIPLKTLPNTTPIVINPLINSTQLPGLLQKALTQSGLFYESHLAKWVTGNYTLAQLQQEPQSKLTTIATMTTSVSTNTDMAIQTQSLPIVQQQLSALETGHLVWQGEIWPNQQMEWDISEHASNGQEHATEELSSRWQMQLSLTLPKLGKVTANILFNSNNINIRLITSATETAEVLISNQPPFATAITSAGLCVQSLEIHADDNE